MLFRIYPWNNGFLPDLTKTWANNCSLCSFHCSCGNRKTCICYLKSICGAFCWCASWFHISAANGMHVSSFNYDLIEFFGFSFSTAHFIFAVHVMRHPFYLHWQDNKHRNIMIYSRNYTKKWFLNNAVTYILLASCTELSWCDWQTNHLQHVQAQSHLKINFHLFSAVQLTSMTNFNISLGITTFSKCEIDRGPRDYLVKNKARKK